MSSKLVFQFMAVSCSLNLETDEVCRVMELLLWLLHAAPGMENFKKKVKGQSKIFLALHLDGVKL